MSYAPAPTRPPAATDSPTNRVAARTVDATKVYGTGTSSVVALDQVSIGFHEGEFTAIMGPSGSGKSTLMHCLAGLDTLTSGATYIGDVDLAGLSDRELTRLRRDRVGFVFQAFNLIPTLTAAENITLPATLARRSVPSDWFDVVVDTVGLRQRLDHRPDELSGGQQQRVAIARALATRPEVIFADEPTGNLDSRSGSDVLRFMRSAVDDHHQTIVMVTHDAAAAAHADRVVFLADGRIVDELIAATTADILDRMKHLGD